MVLSDVFLAPLGLLALLTVPPLVVLYLVKPEPERVELPTLQFLTEQLGQSASSPLLERLLRSLLLVIQVVALVLLATSLAAPYISVSEETTVEETVLVVDGSGSMTASDGGTTRFGQAVAAATEEVTGTTSVVYAAGEPRIAARAVPPDDARTALSDLRVTATNGDLRAALSTASAIAGENAQIVVLSDFADESDWPDAVQAARAQGLRVELRQFAAGGADNVGIIDARFTGREVTVSVKNYGRERVQRALTVGNQRAELTLAPGDVTTATFTVPAGGGQLQLTPTDSFSLDDTVYLAAPEDATIDVLLLTNDRNRYLATALSVIPEVELTVDEPPTTVDSGAYDVIVYSNVDPSRLLRGNVAAGRDLLEAGGGVAIQAQPNLPDRYGDLLLIEPTGTGQSPAIRRTASGPLTRDITFSPPETYISGPLRAGQPAVELGDGSPLIATADRGSGRLLYYGYIEESSSFKFNFQYPVFWKRSVFYLAGRDTLPELNRPAGDRLQFDGETRIQTPSGTVTQTGVVLDQTGYYRVGERRIGVSLLSEPESDVGATSLDERSERAGVPVREETRLVPRPVTEFMAGAALLVTLLELAYLRRRGDL
ncbi:vWA domain-containing protein [Salinigranum halophilum]|uniref:vWA domain-containing protein n=1 Tax=Salinigranum halophilum TaxID=2565931 RepID=UPI0010A919DC|nr:VWA domain-containing protein [Salinigranum halophilum]